MGVDWRMGDDIVKGCGCIVVLAAVVCMAAGVLLGWMLWG